MDKKYQIFISSTYTDLIEERAKVRDAILSMLHFPVGMEFFGAADEDQWDIIKDTIDSSDYYILIIAHKYGSVIKDGEDSVISYTQKEFNYAKERNIPILAFIISDNTKVLSSNIEKKYVTELNRFKEEVKTGRLVEWWENADDLAQKVSIALLKQMDRKKRTGWIRADSFNVEESHAEMLRLNKENRNLKDQILRLEQQLQMQVRIPKLEIVFFPFEDSTQKSNNAYVNSDGSITIKLQQIEQINISELKKEYCPLSMNDIPLHLRFGVGQEELDNYNKQLPNEVTFQKYVNEWMRYNRIEKGVRLTAQISNKGTIKAKNIKIKVIAQSDELLLMDFEYKKNKMKPEKPRLPENPIEKIYKQPNITEKIIKQLDKTYATVPTHSAYVSKSILSDSYISFANNEANIKIQNLMHTEKERFTDCYFVPLVAGTFKIKCEIMCEEYLKAETQFITIHVVE